MASHRLLARLALPCSLALACRGDVLDGEDFDGGWDGTDGTSTTSATTSTSTATSTDTTSTAATETAAEATTGTTAGSTTTADSTTHPPEPVVCGDVMCELGQICVEPCCGGPMPGCYEQPPGGECNEGDTPDEFGARCCIDDPTPAQCMMTAWCIPGPCIPDPPYCAPGETVSCNDSECTVAGGCSGMLFEDGHLQCGGCK